MKIDDLLSKAEAITKAATPGPWWIDGFEITSGQVTIAQPPKPPKDDGKDRYRCKGDISEWRLIDTSPQLWDIPIADCMACCDAIVAWRALMLPLIEVAKAANDVSEQQEMGYVIPTEFWGELREALAAVAEVKL